MTARGKTPRPAGGTPDGLAPEVIEELNRQYAAMEDSLRDQVTTQLARVEPRKAREDLPARAARERTAAAGASVVGAETGGWRRLAAFRPELYLLLVLGLLWWQGVLSFGGNKEGESGAATGQTGTPIAASGDSAAPADGADAGGSGAAEKTGAAGEGASSTPRELVERELSLPANFTWQDAWKALLGEKKDLVAAAAARVGAAEGLGGGSVSSGQKPRFAGFATGLREGKGVDETLLRQGLFEYLLVRTAGTGTVDLGFEALETEGLGGLLEELDLSGEFPSPDATDVDLQSAAVVVALLREPSEPPAETSS